MPIPFVTIDVGAAPGDNTGDPARVAFQACNTNKDLTDANLPLMKFNATTNPAVTDDSGDGYGVGSVWINISASPRRVYVCTNPSLGAAVWLQSGAGGAGGLAASVKTAAYTILASEDVGVDSTSAPFTVNLKASPTIGDVAFIHDVAFICETNSVTVGRNGSTINSLSENAEIDLNGGGFWFIYNGSTWVFTPLACNGGEVETFVGMTEAQVDARFLALFGSSVVNVQSGTSYTVQASDAGKILIFTNASAIAVTQPNTFATLFQYTVVQAGTGVPTVTRSGADTINGAATGVAPFAQWNGMYMTQYAANAWLALR